MGSEKLDAMELSPGDYYPFTVTRDNIAAFVERLIATARHSPDCTAFVQIGCGTVAEGIEMFCSTAEDFHCVLRLGYPDYLADKVRQATAGYDYVRENEAWDVTFTSPKDAIADVLYRAFRDVVGCEEGFTTGADFVNPWYWDHAPENPRQERIDAANLEKNPLLRLYEFLERLDDAGLRYRIDFEVDELQVQVRAGHELYEFVFLPEGDVVYDRLVPTNGAGIYEAQGAGIIDELIALYGHKDRFEEIGEERLRAAYSQVFDRSLAALMHHDPVGRRTLTDDHGCAFYVSSLSHLLPEVRYIVNKQMARSIIDRVFTHEMAGWQGSGPHDQLMNDLWTVWDELRGSKEE